MKKSCPICKSESLRLFLQRKNIPIHQHFVYNTEKDAISDIKSDLNITLCNKCGFIFNVTFEPSHMKYGQYYDNSQHHSKLFDAYLTDLANYFIQKKNVRCFKIVEIGCGDGFFLQKLVSDLKINNRGFGFDPSYSGPMINHKGHLQFRTEFFSKNSLEFVPDVVICRHVIEHIADPISFMSLLRDSLSGMKDTKIFFETPDVNWILNNDVMWDFFYEHCSYFNPQSLKSLFEKCGFNVIEIQNMFHGQYMMLEASLSDKFENILEKDNESVKLVDKFAKNEDNFKKFWNDKILELSSKGKIAVWGGGAKGITFVNLLDPLKKSIDCIIDLNPNKHNKFAAGTGHPIVDFIKIKERKISNIIVMNPNYLEEIYNTLKHNHINVDSVMTAHNPDTSLSS